MSDETLLPFETTLLVRDTCFCMHAQRAARALARRYDRVLRPFGLTNGQFSVLMALNRPGRAVIADLADLLAMDRTTVTALLKPLARRGLLEIETDPKDRRTRGLALTSAGRQALVAALPAWTWMQTEVDGILRRPDRLREELRSLS